jgi:hypothetical protein
MSLTATATTPSPTARFAGFLAVALLLHSLLLLLPARRGLQPEDVLHRISVSLSSVRVPLAGEDSKPSAPNPEPVAATPTPATEPGAATPEPPIPSAARTGRPAPTPPPLPRLSAARLLDLAHRTRWEISPESGSRRLGEPAPGPGTGVRQPIPGLDGSRPDGAATPRAAVEIVDRWQEADGSHHVLVRTPAGDMLCGRAEAWDPMQPLVEHVMRYRTCGSGKSTFEWPEQYRADAIDNPAHLLR